MGRNCDISFNGEWNIVFHHVDPDLNIVENTAISLDDSNHYDVFIIANNIWIDQ